MNSVTEVPGKQFWTHIRIMDKKGLANIITEALTPVGFKKKGNYWLINGNEINKMVNLQKSQYSDRFYINYGYILNSIPLEGEMMHVFNGLGSTDPDENTRVKELLDLENTIADEDRKVELQAVIQKKLIARMKSLHTEEDLLRDLKKRPHLNDIPLTVKKHLKLE